MAAANKFNTAPARMRKRGGLPDLWDMQGILAADAAGGAPAPAATDEPNDSSLNGSWPRVKQRTNEAGTSMSVWEVSAALEAAQQSPPTVDELDSLGLEMLDALTGELAEVE